MPEYAPQPPILVTLIPFLFVLAIVVAVSFLINRLYKRPIASTGPFSSPEVAGMWTKGLLVTTLIMAVIAVVSDVLHVAQLSRLISDISADAEELTPTNVRQMLIGFLISLFYAATAVPFLTWFHRLHKNLQSLGQTGLRFTPGWAVGFFFIPIFNFFRPFQAMREVWHGSDPERTELEVAPESPEGRSRSDTPPLVAWWWGLFLAPGIFNHIAYWVITISQLNEDLAGQRVAAIIMVLTHLLMIMSALVTIRLVAHLTRWQVKKAEHISRQGSQAEIPA